MRIVLLLLVTSVAAQAQCGLACASGTPGLLPGEPQLCIVGVSGASETESRQYFADGEPSTLWTRTEMCDPDGRTTSRVKEIEDNDGGHFEASRVDLTYDDSGRLAQAILSRNRDDAWVPTDRNEYAYDQADRQISHLREVVQYEEGWRPVSRSSTAYDDQDRVAQSILETWDRNEHWRYYGSKTDQTVSAARTVDTRSTRPDTTVAWTPRFEHQTTVDESGRPVLTIYSELDATGAIQELVRRSLYEYSTTGDTLRTSQRREGSDWVNASQTQTQTAPDGRTRVEMISLWDASREEWAPVDRTTSQFDEAGRLVERLFEDRDFVNGGVLLNRRDRWTYMASGLRDEYMVEIWIEDNEAWGLEASDRREYDPEGRIVISEHIYRVARSGQVVSGQLVETSYEPDGRLAGQVSYNRPDIGWQLSSRSTFGHGAPVAIDPSAQATFGLAVWPNPARGTVHIQLRSSGARPARVEVLDVLGRRVILAFEGWAVAGDVAIPVPIPTLAPGHYFVRAHSDEDVAVQPFTVVR